MTEQTHAPAAWGPATETGPRHEGRGWRVFAAVLFILAGLLNVIWGIAAISKDDLFAADELLFGDLTAWGIVYICFGLVQMLAAVLILRRSTFGAMLGVLIAGLHATISLFSIGAYPLWSVAAMVVDILIIYGLTVHAMDEA